MLAATLKASNPRGCPFCLAQQVGLLANFHDTLTAYRCNDCQGVFYTIELQFAAPVVSASPRPRVAHPPSHRRPSNVESLPPLVFLAGRLSFGRRLRRQISGSV